jgi:DDE superfamily endonuclease
MTEEIRLTPTQIYNADETGLLYRALPAKTLAGPTESNLKGHKKNMDRITVLVCANMAGTHRTKLQVIAKYKMPRCIQKSAIFQSTSVHNQTHG